MIKEVKFMHYPIVKVKHLHEAREVCVENFDLFILNNELYVRVKDLKKNYYIHKNKIKLLGR